MGKKTEFLKLWWTEAKKFKVYYLVKLEQQNKLLAVWEEIKEGYVAQDGNTVNTPELGF